MSYALVSDLARNAMMVAMLLAAPLLAVALIIGLLVSILQTVTQIQEQTLSFVPKLLGVAAVFLVGLPWMLQLLVEYTQRLFRSLPAMVNG
ncbi:MAG: flagellar biosynthesis protein FliQ [Gemmatimonadetes bacterium]|jgi:flagellar biosynthetic protein FliQ|nr:flagellar biosynthesis protein FliQ [Gemmatimonadota bacterium]MBK6458357.1 flagellar biosynthesis protein FliQ [Gemmatimonadota bacterium]MBK6843598.1 flagellar biosynthesis protein FliQ [Gemmatimonadota bacterium]MBK7833308.1 flagellar biosynthesis protein FliQ [Gemmatimonadota bacterium]MBK8057557.1 flagellar biosynthesis protein FliQ [Gemmatimonadota bacterium]